MTTDDVAPENRHPDGHSHAARDAVWYYVDDLASTIIAGPATDSESVEGDIDDPTATVNPPETVEFKIEGEDEEEIIGEVIER